jgi:hypothetical protein
MNIDVENNSPKGISVIKNVMDELHDIIKKYNIKFINNTIINVTELIKEAYSEDVTQFKVLTSEIGFLITEFYSPDLSSPEDRPSKSYSKSYSSDNRFPRYVLSIFSDNNIGRLEQVNLSDMLGLFGVDLTKFTYLSKCTFHFNKLYRPEQLDMIPSFQYNYGIDENFKLILK